MKKIGRLLAIFAVAAMLAASLGCSMDALTSGSGKSTAPSSTAAETVKVKEDDLMKVRTFFHDLGNGLKRAETSVVYEDPSIGSKLRASSTLEKTGETLTYRATVDRLNDPAEADKFTTSETLDPVSGTVEEIRQNYSGLFFWDRIATGLVLSAPDFSQGYVDSPVISSSGGKKTMTASVPDDRLTDLFGIALPGVSGMTVEVVYTDTAVQSMKLAYALGAASMTVTVNYSY